MEHVICSHANRCRDEGGKSRCPHLRGHRPINLTNGFCTGYHHCQPAAMKKVCWVRCGPTEGSAGATTLARTGLLCLLLVLVMAVAGCTAGPNPVVGLPDTAGQVAGFCFGMWHGIISPVTFVVSLFTDNVSIYDVHNSGGWYDFGFVLGAGILFSAGDAAHRT